MCTADRTRNAERDDVEDVSGESFTDYVKHLLSKGNNFTMRPDKLRCDLVDPDKAHVFRVGDEGIRTCDLCPYFPQQRYQNVYLDREPTEVRENAGLAECFGACFATARCTAFGYDHRSRRCRAYDSTDGRMEERAGWTTVFMTQPTGVLYDWAYSRHTVSTGPDPLFRRPEATFPACLRACDALAEGSGGGCDAVSYSLADSSCTAYRDADRDVDRVDYAYGHVSAFRMSAFGGGGGDESWRFAETGDGDPLPPAARAADDRGPCAHLNDGGGGARGGYYSKACLTAPAVGCDPRTGCRTCYYPERSAGPEDLSVCPDSDAARLAAAKKTLDAAMRGCLGDGECVGVGVVDAGLAEPITLADLGRRAYGRSFALKYPRRGAAGAQRRLRDYDLAENLAVGPLRTAGGDTTDDTAVRTYAGVAFDECETRFRGSDLWTRMTYRRSDATCALSSEFVRLQRTDGAFTAFKKPSLLSALLNYVRTSGVRVRAAAAESRLRVDCAADCEETCARACNRPANDWCAYVSVEYRRAGAAECRFFGRDDAGLRAEPSDSSVVLVARSKTNFTLAALDRVDPFAGHEDFVVECFSGAGAQQTQTSLTVYGDPGATTAVAVRRRRGLSDWIKKAAKAVSETVVNGVKSTVKEVVDTAKGVVQAVDKAVHGDLEGAKKAALDIPIVKDVKNVVEFGGAVISGDWDTAKEKAADAGSSLLNVGLTFVPGVGKVVGNLGKSAAKGLKPALKNGNKGTKNIKPKKNDSKNENKKKDKQQEDKYDEETCEYRTKRSAAKGNGKKKKKCDPNKCDAPKGITHSFGETFESCDDKKVGVDCSYECKVGYEEKGPSVTCSSVPKKKATWSPKPECSLYVCDAGPYPVVPVMTPKVSGFSSIASSKYIVAYVVLFDTSRKLPVWSAALHQSDQLASKRLV